jgi:hypothetical protein
MKTYNTGRTGLDTESGFIVDPNCEYVTIPAGGTN